MFRQESFDEINEILNRFGRHGIVGNLDIPFGLELENQFQQRERIDTQISQQTVRLNKRRIDIRSFLQKIPN